MNEKCWSIKEERPIPVPIWNRADGSCDIGVEPMSMTYDTWEHLDQNHRHQDIGVRGFSYDYRDGKAEFICNSRADADLWLEKYKDIVREA